MSHQTDNDKICAGTQVVALTEVRGTNNSLVHPRGAVGVVNCIAAGEKAGTKFPGLHDYEVANRFLIKVQRILSAQLEQGRIV